MLRNYLSSIAGRHCRAAVVNHQASTFASFASFRNPASRRASSLLPALSDLLRPLVLGLPKVVEETAKTLIKVKEQYSELKSANESTTTQLESFRNAADRMTAECDALKLKISQQGEELARLRALPFTIINTQLSEISRRFEILNVAPRPSEAPIRPTKIPRPIEPIDEPSTDIKLALKLLQYFLIIVLVIGIVGAIAYGILEFLKHPFRPLS
ncbi:MAG: hypothetical protein FJ194_13400 [Gammaproteobacteria bacterium]|nr:hypothetical protein [Gammaproteobacteria bacterium]